MMNETVVMCGCFFFQAEDGIRDLVRSRGLGDVYKRQVVHKDSPYYDLADLKGKTVSVPFGSAAHGMMLQLSLIHI